MSNLDIEIITCPSGDWEVLKVHGFVLYEGHCITKNQFISVLKLQAAWDGEVSVSETQISDEAMDEGLYYGTK